jgi:ABC-type cobalamin/Fe3+-siderophores transport system ATPase subunit
LEHVGPFEEARIALLEGPDDPRAVTLITGENGTGKTVVLDAIRRLFGLSFAKVERDLSRHTEPLRIDGVFANIDAGKSRTVRVDEPAHSDWKPSSEHTELSRRQLAWSAGRERIGWVTAYWRSELAHDAGTVDALRAPDVRQALAGSLQGNYKNVDVAQTLVYLDYLRDSRNPDEKRAGDALWGLAERIVGVSLLEGGKLAGIERSTFTPMVEQAGRRVPLANLSSGNAYLIGRMLTLLGRMYSVVVAENLDATRTNEIPGLLLIDEAENHLHPKWQKRFLPIVREIFPNLQIIATTHSPFVLGSVADARVFVCRYDEARSTCTIEEHSGGFASLPVDEILASPAFDGTRPFSAEISELLRRRDEAIDRGDVGTRRELEHQLVTLNPTYFAWLRLDEALGSQR